VLTYSRSGDPTSPHFTDQTELFARKQCRPVLFSCGRDRPRCEAPVHGESAAGARWSTQAVTP